MHTIQCSDNPRRTLHDMYEPSVGLDEICPPPGGYTCKDRSMQGDKVQNLEVEVASVGVCHAQKR